MPGQYTPTTDQDREDRRKHLDLIQGIISRLATASATIKGWSVTLAGAAFGVAAIRGNWYLYILGLAALLALGWLDAHYLETERDFRNLHDATADNYMTPFCLTPAKIPSEALPAHALSGWSSWSVKQFYGPLLVLGIILTIIGIARG